MDNPEKEIKKYNHLVQLCDNDQFATAKQELNTLLDKNPTVSDYWRIKGQIAEIEKRYDDAINDLINALKWDPSNTEALIMMGNVYARHHKDISTAMIFFNKAVEQSPKDIYAINNIGGILLQENKYQAAIPYFEKVITIDPSFVNPYHGLGICHEQLNSPQKAFDCYSKAYLIPNADHAMKDRAMNAINRIVQIMSETDYFHLEFNRYISELEDLSQKPIKIENAPNLQVMAKVLIAEVYNKPAHVLKFKDTSNCHTHLMMHELMHLDFILEARRANCNKLFTATNTERQSFNDNIDNFLSKAKTHLTKESFNQNLRNILFDGLNSQIYNTPIDLFIEQALYDRYPRLRPIQFLSIYNIIQVGIKAATDPNILRSFPEPLVSKSRILNLVLAIQYKDLYKIDLIEEFKASPKERHQAQTFYEEYLEYKNDRKPGEEYEIIQHWAEDLKLDTYFKLEPNPHNITSSTTDDPIDQTLKAIDNDPFDHSRDEEAELRANKAFADNQRSQGLNMAVVMYMKDALDYFSDRPFDKIQAIAFDIAMLGRQGFNTNKTDYRIPLLPNKTFTGYEILAWYYTTWALTKPNVLPELGLPYDKEYKLASTYSK